MNRYKFTWKKIFYPLFTKSFKTECIRLTITFKFSIFIIAYLNIYMEILHKQKSDRNNPSISLILIFLYFLDICSSPVSLVVPAYYVVQYSIEY